MSVVEVFFGGTLALVCLAAMWSDLRSRTIPNSYCAALLLAGLALGYHEGALGGLGWHAAHAGTALLIGMALFALRWLGGGDGKFYAACAAWFPLQQGLALGSMICLAGLLLALSWIVWRKVQGKPTFTLRQGQPTYLPFGLAIGLGTLATFALRF
ncbi:prepilin peptidase [Novosphingobium aquiterrae]|uniref:Prepilin peptidase n=1 Tax=Novosphingobium aquiterrae TaxID=624388 RepID=A0ABV6PLE0_9SPHN